MMAHPLELSGSQDFDFFFGRWTVAHRRLRTRLAHCHDWDEFGGTSHVQPLLGGLGNVDDNLLHLPEASYRAVTLRAFDPASGMWSIWWLDGRRPTQLDVPMRGRFEQGVGKFYADDVFEGKAIKVRFVWDARVPAQPVWEQAFSLDDGTNWETNWVMRFARAETAV